MHCDGCEDSDHFCDDDSCFQRGHKALRGNLEGHNKVALPSATSFGSDEPDKGESDPKQGSSVSEPQVS